MRLFHGTNADFESIDFGRCNPFKDFGRGFYLTDIRAQAQAMAIRRTRIGGGTPIVQQYNFDEDSAKELNVLRFDGPSKEWAEFIFRNRTAGLNFKHDFDIVIGPIADDGVAYLLGRFEEGTLSIEELASELKYKNLNSQYYFGTLRALNLLHRLC